MELYSPQIQVVTEHYIFTRGVELELNSCEDTAFDWAKLQFVKPMERAVTIGKRERVQILLGYNGTFETVFTGYAVSDFTSGLSGNEILLKDGMLLLEAVTVNQTFLQATPQEIVSYCAGLAGVTGTRLDTTAYSPIACLPIFSQNAIRAIRSLGGCWGISPKFFFQDDILHWGAAAPQAKLYHFEHGKNIINLRLTGGYWELLTVSVPFIRHSQKIRVTHPAITGDFLVHRTRVITKPQGFIRTTLYFIAV